jgi:hypothetical protein
VKGLGEVIIDVVRERGGVTRDDVRTFAEGDRFKVIVTCGTPGEAEFGVSIREETSPKQDFPLGFPTLVCGNRVALPGAFSLSGKVAHKVCVHVQTEDGGAGDACLWLSPE